VARYEQGRHIDEPLAESRGGSTSYYEADGLGSVTSLTDSTGALAQTYTYDSFGNLVASTGTIQNSFRFTGREFDIETSLYSYRARYYDESVGRFISEDPMKFTGGIDFFTYVGNRPTNKIDPLGLWPPKLGDVWNWGKRLKDAWDTATEYADRIGCLATYANCLLPTFDNAACLTKASQNDVRNTITPNDLQNPSASLGLKNFQDAVAGNGNCGKQLQDCLAGVVAGGILPH
jgi:RHS repeat-associated protein